MIKKILLVASILTMTAGYSLAGVHQSAAGPQAYVGGDNAVTKGKAEVNTFGSSTCARVKSDMSQWGYVTYWMGIPTPSGNSIIRVRLYNDGEPSAKYAAYITADGGHKGVGSIVIPEGTPVGEFVDVDLDVYSDSEWSGIVLKKMTKDAEPSPWIESISVILD
jgi:hypothetical protein